MESSISYDEAVIKARATQTPDRNWVLGDLANSLETTYGEQTLYKFAEDIEENYLTLKQYRLISRAYEKGRRLPNLTWSHHQTVAARPDRDALLKQASKNKWPVAKLRQVVRELRDKEEIKIDSNIVTVDDVAFGETEEEHKERVQAVLDRMAEVQESHEEYENLSKEEKERIRFKYYKEMLMELHLHLKTEEIDVSQLLNEIDDLIDVLMLIRSQAK